VRACVRARLCTFINALLFVLLTIWSLKASCLLKACPGLLVRATRIAISFTVGPVARVCDLAAITAWYWALTVSHLTFSEALSDRIENPKIRKVRRLFGPG